MRHFLALLFALIALTVTTPAMAQLTPADEAFNRGIDADRQNDYAAALREYTQACDLGDAGGCTNLGVMYSIGRGTAQDQRRALALFQKGCDGGVRLSCKNLGLMYDNAKGVDRNLPLAVAAYEKSCRAESYDWSKPRSTRENNGDPETCYNLGHYFYFGNFPDGTGIGGVQDKVKAAKYWTVACGLKSADGCYYAAIMYKKGDGVPPNLEESGRLFEQACFRGVKGCYETGLYYYEESSRVKNSERQRYLNRALDGFRQACDGGIAEGCYQYGIVHSKMYKDKRGLWTRFETACSGGIAAACLHLGDLYFKGEGVPKDKARAAIEYEKACKGGNAEGCAKLRK